MLLGGRTSTLQPGAVLQSKPVQIWTRPGSCNRVKHGGAKSRKSGGACSFQYSENPGSSDRTRGCHWPSSLTKTSEPFQRRLTSSAGKAYQPKEEAIRMASQ